MDENLKNLFSIKIIFLLRDSGPTLHSAESPNYKSDEMGNQRASKIQSQENAFHTFQLFHNQALLPFCQAANRQSIHDSRLDFDLVVP